MSHVRKPKLVEQRLTHYAPFIVTNPAAARGAWRKRFATTEQPAALEANGPELAQDCAKQPRTSLHVDLGCGKGLWTTRVAAANPHELFVGVDMERMCVSFAAERAGIERLANALFLLDTAGNVGASFADGEVDVLHVNFPTPFPRLKDAPKRITCARRLMEYRRMLGEGSLLCLKTDSQFMFQFTLDQLQAAGYTVLWQTRDLHGEYAPEAACDDAAAGPLASDFVESAYERKLIANGAKVHVLHAVPGPAPAGWEPAPFVSLFDYLPDNLESITYAPLGMEDAITNMRNHQRNARAKAAQLNRKP